MAKSIQISKKIEVGKDIIEWVSMLSYGWTVAGVAKYCEINKRTMEAKLAETKKQFDLKTSNHMVAFFLRNKLIK